MSVVTVIGIGYAVCVALLATGIWRVSRRAPKQLGTPARPASLSAVLDTEPGINLALHDECELLFAMPAYTVDTPGPDLAGLDRLLRAVRDEQKGEQA